MQFFSDLAYQWTARQKQNLAQREPRDENDARTSNTRIVQRNRALDDKKYECVTETGDVQ